MSCTLTLFKNDPKQTENGWEVGKSLKETYLTAAVLWRTIYVLHHSYLLVAVREPLS